MLRFDNAPKRATNPSLNVKVLDVARELGMNLSATVDALLTEEVRKRYWGAGTRKTRRPSRTTTRIEREGLPLGRYRSFMKGR